MASLCALLLLFQLLLILGENETEASVLEWSQIGIGEGRRQRRRGAKLLLEVIEQRNRTWNGHYNPVISSGHTVGSWFPSDLNFKYAKYQFY